MRNTAGRAADVSSGQLATIIYTSGTTGEPKGVMLNHSNLSSNAFDGLEGYDFHRDDLALSFLPLAHVYERTHGLRLSVSRSIGGLPGQMETVRGGAARSASDDHRAPSRASSRRCTRTFSRKGHRETGLKRAIFDWALRVAAKAVPWRAYGREVPAVVKLEWRIADKLVYSKIREGVGGRIRNFVSGGAPLAPELAEFFWSVNLPVFQGYGLTETSPIVAANLPPANKVGTVGRPIPHVELRIADDGEILVKGPCVMQGYYSKPDETRAGDYARWMVLHRRHRQARCGRLPDHHRPQERAAENGGREVRGACAHRESAEDQPLHRRTRSWSATGANSFRC